MLFQRTPRTAVAANLRTLPGRPTNTDVASNKLDTFRDGFAVVFEGLKTKRYYLRSYEEFRRHRVGGASSPNLSAVVVYLDLALVLCLSPQVLFSDRVGVKPIGICHQPKAQTEACHGG